MSTLAVRGLHCGHRGRPVIAGLDLAPMAAGGLHALIGPNGAGKSTLLRAMAGIQPARGSLLHDGVELLALPHRDRARRIGFMPQALPHGARLGVLDSIIAAARAAASGAAPPPGHDARRHAVAVMERLGILRFGMTALDSLSGGERQLAAIAQALVRDPAILLLDEPVSALDPAHQFTVMALLRTLAREGRIIVVVLHDLGLASRWADRIVMLRHGALLAEGTPEAVLTPANLGRAYGVETAVERRPQGHLDITITGLRRPARAPEE